MPTIDLGAASTRPAHSPGLLAALPRRLTLTLPELQVVAERAGSAPLPFDLRNRPADSPLSNRLGRTPALADSAAYAAAVAALHEPEAALSRRGLLVDGALDEGLAGAIGLLASPAVALDLDVTAGGGRVRAWHRQRAGAVASLATADGIAFELAWFATEAWGRELGRVAVVPPELTDGVSSVPDRVDLPYALVDAAAEAAHSRRGDLVSVLVAEHAADCLGEDGAPLPAFEVVALLDALVGECRGRLRVLAADVTGDRTGIVGVVSWVLLPDGWRALRPRAVDGVERVSAVRVVPADLASELAPVLAEVVR
jgi:hypothetical protein